MSDPVIQDGLEFSKSEYGLMLGVKEFGDPAPTEPKPKKRKLYTRKTKHVPARSRRAKTGMREAGEKNLAKVKEPEPKHEPKLKPKRVCNIGRYA